MNGRRGHKLPSNRSIERLEERILLAGDDTLATATLVPLTPNVITPISGNSIDPAGDRDFYQVTLAAGDTLTADIDAQSISSSLDSYLRLFDSTGQEVANNDDDGTGSVDSLITFPIVSAGTYYIGVSGLGTDTMYDPTIPDSGAAGSISTGVYTLKLLVVPSTDAGDTLATAQDVDLTASVPKTISGDIDPAGDVDLYKVALTTGDRLAAHIDAVGNGNSLTGLVRVFDAAGVELTPNQNGKFTATTTGNYYVGISDAGNGEYDPDVANSGEDGATGAYTLTLEATPTPLPDGNDTISTASPAYFLRNQTFSFDGSIASASDSDVDIYRLANLVAGETLHLDIVAQSSGSSLDARLRLFDSAGHELATNDNSTGLDSSLTFVVIAADTYYVGVSGAENAAYNAVTGAGAVTASSGDYQLKVRVDSVAAVSAEAEPNNSIGTPNVILPNGSVAGSIGVAGDADFYLFNVTNEGTFTAQVNADTGSPLNARLTLFGADGRVWQTSDDQAPGQRDPLITVQLKPGSYYLEVDSSAASTAVAATGAYHLNTNLVEGSSSFEPISLDPNISNRLTGITAGDFNNDGIADLVGADGFTGTVYTMFGTGNLAYRPAMPTTFSNPMPLGTIDVVSGDFNGDHKLDLAVTNSADNTISILLGNGDGSFAVQSPINVGHDPEAIAVADFNGDHILDLAVADAGEGSVTILLGQGSGGTGNGTFTSGGSLLVGNEPVDVIAADFNHDNHLDLATANRGSDTVSVLLNNGSGGFLPEQHFAAGDQPTSLTAADLNGDSQLDLAVANAGSFNVTLLFGAAGGAFGSAKTIDVFGGRTFSTPSAGDTFRSAISQGDFNHDGRVDLIVTSSKNPQTLSVALGKSNGTFAISQISSDVAQPWASVVSDFDNDGRADFAVTDFDVSQRHISIFGGLGDGSFRRLPRIQAGDEPRGLALADLNHDGQLDLVTANADGSSVLLGHGDGTFADQLRADAGRPNAVATGDFNLDGRIDIASADYETDPVTGAVVASQVIVLYGIGDGTYTATTPISVGNFLSSIVTSDFNGDGIPDLAVTSEFENTVVVLLGRRDAAGHFDFIKQNPMTVGNLPAALVIGDFDHDGKSDLATANIGDGTVSILLGDGHGAYTAQSPLTVGDSPDGLAVADFNGDHVDDLAVADSGNNRVSILFGAKPNAGQSFDAAIAAGNAIPLSLAAGEGPRAIVAGDFNGDGRVDVATANGTSNDISVLINLGGVFAPQKRFFTATDASPGDTPAAIVTGDFNGDGRLDLATANSVSRDVTVLLGDGNGNFDLSRVPPAGGAMTSPLLADFTGDGTPDSVTMDRAGNVLLRLGRPGEPGHFEPALVVNVAAAATSFAVFQDGNQNLLGVLSRDGKTLTLYRFLQDGTPVVVSISNLAAQNGRAPYNRISAAKLNGDNRDDLIAVSSANQTLSMFLRSGNAFDVAGRVDVPVGNLPSDVVAANLDGVGGPDLLVSDPSFGDVNVILGGFQAGAAAIGYRAGDSPTGVSQIGGQGAPMSPLVYDGATAIAVGDFNEDSFQDAIIAHRGTNSISLLLGTGRGALANASDFLAGSRPSAIRVADFNHDHHDDLAVLNAGTHDVAIYLGDGHGHFTLQGAFDAGNVPIGLSVFDVTGDGQLDLMVGNEFGDVTTLVGNGDGTFQPFTRIDRSMAISVGDLNGDGKPDWAITNRTGDRLVVQNDQQNAGVVQTGSNGITAPAGVKVVDLNGDGAQDMIVANSGTNSVLVYLGLKGANGKPTGQFADPLSFFAGTDPVDVQVARLNADNLLDVVVTNKGSNDVSILIGTGDSSVLKTGERLNVGAGPVNTQVVDSNHDGIADGLLVTNGTANTVSMLPSVGSGFFNDINPTVFNTGRGPTQTLVGNFDRRPGLDFVTVNFNSNSLTFYSGFGSGSVRSDLSSGGTNPLTAIAADFNKDGALDLLVGNNGNGVFSVFEGAQAGLSLMNSFSDPTLLHPAALALADFGQGKELQLLALDEGDESVREFGRGTILADSNNNSPLQAILPGLSNDLLNSLVGGNSSGLSVLASVVAALGISAEALFSQTTTAGVFEGSGQVTNRLFSLEFLDGIGSAISTGQRWIETAWQGLESAVGIDIDDKQLVKTVEDVVSLLFPQLPVQAIPSLFNGIISGIQQTRKPTPLATDQAMEDYRSDTWNADDAAEAESGAVIEDDQLVDASTGDDPNTSADWNSATESRFADQLAAVLAAGQHSGYRGNLAFKLNRQPLAGYQSATTKANVAKIPNVVKLFDGTTRFGKSVPKILVPPVGIVPQRESAPKNENNLKAKVPIQRNLQAVYALAAMAGTLSAGSLAYRDRRPREKTAGVRHV